MANNGATVIGRETRIRARVSGGQDFEIHGHLEGELTVGGDVQIEQTATIAADVRARRIVVRGAVKGDLSAEESVLLEEGARVVGDVRAPRVAIGVGALVRGYVETGKAGEAPRKAASAAARVVTMHRPAAAPAKAAPKAASKPAAKPAPHAKKAPGSRMSIAGGKAPPPVVPSLKKGTKAALTKKRG